MHFKEQVLTTKEAKAKSARWAGRLKTLEKISIYVRRQAQRQMSSLIRYGPPTIWSII